MIKIYFIPNIIYEDFLEIFPRDQSAVKAISDGSFPVFRNS